MVPLFTQIDSMKDSNDTMKRGVSTMEGQISEFSFQIKILDSKVRNFEDFNSRIQKMEDKIVVLELREQG